MADLSRGGRRRYVVLLMVLTAFTLATLDSRSGDSGPIGAAGRLAHRVVQPVANAANSVFSPLHDWWRGFAHHGDIVDENRALRTELDKERAVHRADAAALRQNAYLQQWFNLTAVRRYRVVGARVVSNAPGNYETTVVINRGRESGIRPGMAVVGVAGLVGRVVKAWNGGADVRLVSDPTFGVSVRLIDAGQFTTASKTSTDRYTMTFADQPQSPTSRVRATSGDIVVTCGCNGSDYPFGIPVGTVVEVSRPDASKVVVEATTMLDPGALDVVNVLLWLPGDPTPPNVVPPTTTTPTTTSASTPATTPATQPSIVGATTTTTGSHP